MLLLIHQGFKQNELAFCNGIYVILLWILIIIIIHDDCRKLLLLFAIICGNSLLMKTV